MKVRRAGIPHAIINKIDTSEAEAMPGVYKVVTGEEEEIKDPYDKLID